MMLHRLDQQMQASHMPYLVRPKSTAIDDLFGIDLTFWGPDFPAAIRALAGACYRCLGEILSAKDTRALAKG